MKRMLLISFSLVVMSACATARGPLAVATFTPAANSPVRGMIHFQEMADGGVEVEVSLTGVPPGQHGFHVHEGTRCAEPGTHFNPNNMPHAGPEAVSHHAGDFGNLTANDSGEVQTRFTTRSVTVRESPASIVGRTVVIHDNRDDMATQPSGNAGDPMACAEIALRQMAGSMHR